MPAKNTKQTATKKEVVNEPVVESAPAAKNASKKEVVNEPVVESAPAAKNAARTSAKKEKAPPAKKQTPAKKQEPAKKSSPAKKEKQTPAKTAEEGESSEPEEERGAGYRYFKILANKIQPQNGSPEIAADHLSLKGGRFKGRNPMQAAKKAYTKICNIATKSGYEGDCFYIFTIQETSQKSGKKEFTYQGERHRLENPEPIVKDGNTYYVKFSSNVKSYKQAASSEAAEAKPQKPAATRAKKNVRIETPAEASSSSAPSPAEGQQSPAEQPAPAQAAPEQPAPAQAAKSEPKQAPKGRGRAAGAK